MQVTIHKPTQIEVTHIFLELPVRYGEEDIPNDFPLRNGDMWSAKVEMDSGKIIDWPADPRFQECRLDMKVCDSGRYTLYTLYGDHWDKVAELQDYVPHGVVPGEYGDYVELHIKNGVIVNWPRNPDLSTFNFEAQ